MSERHSEISAYVACGDTRQVADAVVALCTCEGMRPIAAAPLPLAFAPAAESNYWAVAVLPGAPGWQVVLSMPEDLLCEPGAAGEAPRFVALCESLGVPGLLREVHAGMDGENHGRVCLEADGRGRHALSGSMWRAGREDGREDAHTWYGQCIADRDSEVELRLIESLLPSHWDEDPEALRSDLEEARRCGRYAQRLGGAASRFWEVEAGWRWVIEALRLGGPMPVPGGIQLTFAWPALDRPQPRVESGRSAAEEEFWSAPRHFYGDGSEIREGDAIRLADGERATVANLTVTNFDGGLAPGGVVVESIDGSSLIPAQYFPGLRLLARALVQPARPTPAALAELAARAEAGNAAAQYRLGRIHAAGDGVAANPLRANFWLRKAAETGHASAQYELGRRIEGGIGAPADWQEASHWLEMAARQGDAAACRRLVYGWNLRGDEAKAGEWLAMAAELGDESGQFLLGWAYRHGIAVPQDYSRAAFWFRRAAEQGSRSAQFHLGLCCEYGWGRAQDCEEAVRWYRQAAEAGDPGAQCNLADKYEHGLGVPQDLSLAVHWYRKSAEQGVPPAIYSLGLMFRDGRGVPRDLGKSRQALEMAASRGYADAQAALDDLPAPD